MDAFPDVTPIWDFSNPSYAQLPDDDFMAMLQKQFPQATEPLTFGGLSDAVNPQSIQRHSLPSITPPSEDSSPSPPNSHHDSPDHDDDNSAPKRKASIDDLQEGPSQKSQHTLNNDRKAGTTGTRRKSTGNAATPKDEGRLMKRKEQNRAAQRAFRERKEKHVKDLEDKVAALETKNEEAVHENENLRDLLTQLQNENLVLKQTSFTFSVPKNAASSVDPARGTYSTDFGSTRSPIASISIASPPKSTNPLDWSSLTAFDPSMLNLLDDGLPQPTATEGAMHMDFGFGSNNTGLASNSPYTTIASNPSFMTFASAFDTTMSPPSVDANPTASTSNSGNNTYNFDMNNLSTWGTSPQPNNNQEFDDLLSGYLGNTNNVDFSFMNTPSLSPISRHLNKPSPAASSSSSSPSFSGSDPLFSSPRESLTSDSDTGHDESECPKTRSDLLRKIVETGPSPFGPPMPLRKRTDSVSGSMITCAGSSFPKTVKSDQNIEVLSAWRSITSNPNFKDTDINTLCQEFTSKARCDGTKVVLEPQGVHSILESLSKK